MARSGESDHVVIKQSTRKVTWQRKQQPIARRIVTVDVHLRGGCVVHADSSVNRFINNLKMAEIKLNEMHLKRPIVIHQRAFDAFLKHTRCGFILTIDRRSNDHDLTVTICTRCVSFEQLILGYMKIGRLRPI